MRLLTNERIESSLQSLITTPLQVLVWCQFALQRFFRSASCACSCSSSCPSTWGRCTYKETLRYDYVRIAVYFTFLNLQFISILGGISERNTKQHRSAKYAKRHSEVEHYQFARRRSDQARPASEGKGYITLLFLPTFVTYLSPTV